MSILSISVYCIEDFMSGLPKISLNADQIFDAIKLDKKRSGDRIRFVLLERPGKPFIVDNVQGRTLRAVITRTIDIYNRLGGMDA